VSSDTADTAADSAGADEYDRSAAEAAEAADLVDPLGAARDRFVLPEGLIYLDGNSLGAMPAAVLPAMNDALSRQWAGDLIRSWNDNDWWSLPGRVGDRIGSLIGAAPGQVMCGDSTSVQLFQALVAACRMRPGRTVLLTDGDSFPTDQYIADAVGRLLDLEVVRVHPNDVGEHLDARTAAVLFSLVDYRTGELFDAAGITGAVQRAGAVMVWDLCHAAGALLVELDSIGAEFAVGCGYKYLNGGPGAPAFIYIAERLLAELELPLTGWHGHRTPFGLDQHYTPSLSVEQARIGTPPLLSMLALDAALDAFTGTSMDELRAKSLGLTDRAIHYADARLAEFGVEVVTPREHRRRGSQVSLRMPQAYEVCQALIARGVIGDFRAPDLLRLGYAPLYLRHIDVQNSMQILYDVLATGAYQDPAYAHRNPVT
jgi:kynureninase